MAVKSLFSQRVIVHSEFPFGSRTFPGPAIEAEDLLFIEKKQHFDLGKSKSREAYSTVTDLARLRG